MKKIFCILLMLLAVACVGCGKKDTVDNSTADSKKDDSFSVTLDGITIVPGEDFAEAKDKLGEPVDYYEGQSCYFEGLDKVFTYDGFEVSTYPQGDNDIVLSVQIATDKYKADGGVTVGSELKAVTDAYGDKFQQTGNNYKYYVDDTHYTYFFMLNDAVKYFGYAVEPEN